ncbi:serine/threonine-protein phosphatase 4 regulatory subunit 1-like isoform X2 [Planococcus citri]|uniref:serine/threonine-protein phosphatase 4 regulatory subunit 1-like isoform X2 n=1 Tax=Planococcus citri TaxID=170843 RepID=UPI0031FA1C8B
MKRKRQIRYSEEEEEEERCVELETGYGRVPVNTIVDEYISVALLAEYAESNYAFLRISAAKQILDVLQQAVSSVEAYSEHTDVEKVFAKIAKLSQDEEPMVKCTLLNSLQKVASFCAEYDSPLVSLKPLIVTDILVIVLKDIADEFKTRNIKVRKEAYNTLKYLLHENLISKQNIEDMMNEIYTALVDDPRNVLNVIAAGNFIARMPPVVGEEVTEKLLLPKISELCSHPQPKVREACVHFLIDLACFVNSMITENIIVPLFVKLSQDDEWYVIKACAETSVMLSCLCLMESRKTVLCHSFIELLQYGYNVTPAAFKHLGPFITTFAQPAITGLACNLQGDFVLVYDKDFEFPLHSRRALFQFNEEKLEDCSYVFMLPKNDFSYEFTNDNNTIKNVTSDEDSFNNNSNNSRDSEQNFSNEFTNLNEGAGQALGKVTNQDENANNDLNSISYDNQPDLVQSCLQKVINTNAEVDNKAKNTTITEGCPSSPETLMEIQDHFNSFQFWRDPIPEFEELDLPTVTMTETSMADYSLNDYNEEELKTTHSNDLFYKRASKKPILLKQFRDSPPRSLRRHKYYDAQVGTLPSESGHELHSTTTTPCGISSAGVNGPKQTIVPQILVDYFVTMPETYSMLTIDCAYTFPAVLLTLGASNWNLLKELYCKLALDGEKKVRKMIANNIHEIASILGAELATQDLIPVYNSLIDDLEDVRITALNHISSFIKLLKPNGRSLFLPHLMEFMMTDYSWNWRFRKQLSEQLIEMMTYFSASDCWKYVSPVALTLLTDRVSAVRLQALSLVTYLIRALAADITLLRGILAELAEQFAHSTQWSRRQSFAFLCSCLLKDPVLPDDMFARDVLPHLLDLSWDIIPNVRIAVARTLACDVMTYPFFSNIFSPHYDVLTQVLKRLCNDRDRDVRYFASLKSQPLPSLTHFDVSY